MVFLNALLRIYVYAVQRAVKDAKLFKAGYLGRQVRCRRIDILICIAATMGATMANSITSTMSTRPMMAPFVGAQGASTSRP